MPKERLTKEQILSACYTQNHLAPSALFIFNIIWSFNNEPSRQTNMKKKMTEIICSNQSRKIQTLSGRQSRKPVKQLPVRQNKIKGCISQYSSSNLCSLWPSIFTKTSLFLLMCRFQNIECTLIIVFRQKVTRKRKQNSLFSSSQCSELPVCCISAQTGKRCK